MMNNLWYDTFIKTLHKKFPKKNLLAEALMDLLSIERESAYRRLRKEIIFPTHELVKIASAWSISLDELIGIMSHKALFRLHPINYFEPSKEDMEFIQSRVRWLGQLKDVPNSEYIVVSNNLSRSLTAGYLNLYRLCIFKWEYQYGRKKENIPYSRVIIQEKLLNELVAYYQSMKDIKNTTYILDSMIFDNIVREIRFFHSIFLLTDEDKELIKGELYALLDYLLEVANMGCFPETKNKVQIYIPVLNINTSYSYFFDGQTGICTIHAFDMYDNVSSNPELIEDFKAWMQKKKKIAVQISEVDEKSRIEFFRKQRRLIDEL